MPLLLMVVVESGHGRVVHIGAGKELFLVFQRVGNVFVDLVLRIHLDVIH